MGISLEDAAVTCAGFELAFSDDGMRRAIFGIIDQLDESAAKKGEPLGLIIRYAVELGQDGIWVGRYADEIPAGEIVELTPTDRAMIFLKIKDNFPTQEFLGPMIVNRPEFLINPKSEIRNPKSNCGVVFSDGEFTEPEIPTELPSHWPDVPICLGPIRLKFNERFPCVSATKSSSQPAALQAGMPAFQSKALDPLHHLPPWAALQAGTPAFQSTSGLSPPRPSENLGHSDAKDVPPALAIDVRDICLTSGSLKFDRDGYSPRLCRRPPSWLEGTAAEPRSFTGGYRKSTGSGTKDVPVLLILRNRFRK